MSTSRPPFPSSVTVPSDLAGSRARLPNSALSKLLLYACILYEQRPTRSRSTAKTIVTATTTAAARPLPSRANTTASNVSSKSTAAASTKSSATTSTTRAKVKGIVQPFRVIPRNEVRKSISKLAGEQKRRSSAGGVKRFGSRRLGKAVEKGRALFSSPGKRI